MIDIYIIYFGLNVDNKITHLNKNASCIDHFTCISNFNTTYNYCYW